MIAAPQPPPAGPPQLGQELGRAEPTSSLRKVGTQLAPGSAAQREASTSGPYFPPRPRSADSRPWVTEVSKASSCGSGVSGSIPLGRPTSSSTSGRPRKFEGRIEERPRFSCPRRSKPARFLLGTVCGPAKVKLAGGGNHDGHSRDERGRTDGVEQSRSGSLRCLRLRARPDGEPASGGATFVGTLR